MNTNSNLKCWCNIEYYSLNISPLFDTKIPKIPIRDKRVLKIDSLGICDQPKQLENVIKISQTLQ